MTLQEWIDRAVSIATRGVKPGESPELASEMVAEDLLETVAQEVALALASNRNTRSLLRSSVVLSFTDGTATLPDSVLTEYSHESNLFDVTSETTTHKRYSYEPRWEEFVRPFEVLIGQYHIDGQTISVIEPSARYSPSTGLTGSRTLFIPKIPDIPAAAADTVVASPEVMNRLVMALADALLGNKIAEGAPAA